MATVRDTRIYRQDDSLGGKLLSTRERENLLRPYLPAPPDKSPQAHRRRTQPLREFIKSQLHFLIYAAIHLVFSVYIRIRQTQYAVLDRTFAILYYHHRAPELIKQDVKTKLTAGGCLTMLQGYREAC